MNIFLQIIIKYIIFFGCALTVVIGLANYVKKKKIQALINAVFCLILLEFFLTHHGGFLADMKDNPGETLFFLFVRLIKYSVGPLFFFYFISLIHYKKFSPLQILIHFTPQVLAWTLGIIYFLSSILKWESFLSLRTITGLVTELSFGHIFVYLLFSFAAFYRIGSDEGGEYIKKLLFSTGMLFMAIIVFFTAYFVTGYYLIESLPYAVLSLVIIIMHLYMLIAPSIIEKFSKKNRNKSYKYSLLKGMDSSIIAMRLEDLMKSEKLYCDEDLSLDRLASLLSITKNQLSELVNTVMGQNYLSYINSYRINEAKRLLIDEPNRSILSIAYASGFNSKSVFYSLFKRKTEVSPSEYRRMNAPEP